MRDKQQHKKSKIKHVMEAYEENFTLDSTQEHFEKLRNEMLAGYRVKTIKAGPILEMKAYPFWHAPQPGEKRKKQGRDSSKSQNNLNDRNAREHVARLINTNFREFVDLWLHLTYGDSKRPSSPEIAKKDMTNYIRRLKNWLKKQPEYKNFKLKYLYVTEHTDGAKEVRAHHHMVTNFPDRDVAERIWTGGKRANARRLQADRNSGFEALARYITKEKKSKTTKRYTPSRNLKPPIVTVSDTKLTRRRAEKIAKEEVSAQEIFEKMYPNYQFNGIEVKFSEFTSGAYLYVKMHRIATDRRDRQDE